MVSKRLLFLVSSFLLVALVSAACGLIAPGGAPSADDIATSVAATVNAVPGGATDASGPGLPTVVPPPAATEAPPPVLPPTSYPLSVAFVSPDRNAYFWNETMSAPIMLTSSGDVDATIVSPDGTLVAITRTTDWESYSLDVINSDGSNLRTLINPGGFAAFPRPTDAVASVPNQLSWVPGTKTLAMTTRITYAGPGYQTGENLYLVNTDSASVSTLLTIPSQWSWHYFYSPDGTKLAISYPEGMDIYTSAGALVKKPALVYPFINTASEYAWSASPTWSADSTALAAAVPPQEPFSDPIANSSVYLLTADGLTGGMTFSNQMSFHYEVASFAPDLTKLAFLAPFGIPTDNQSVLRLSNIDGSGLSDYTTGQIYNLPVWSTDSSKFFYLVEGTGAWIGQAGVAPVSVPDFNNSRNVAWIDANRFIGASGPDGGWKLLLGTIGAPTGVIFSSSSGSKPLRFTVNR